MAPLFLFELLFAPDFLKKSLSYQLMQNHLMVT